uniref:CCHC-type domain-containing protein n=1 Tax=Esox lucius TaxID=8010 RepID=A0AAY5KKK2_ESOLU
MAAPTVAGAASWAGVRNTLRFQWKGSEESVEPWGREQFGRLMLLGALKLGTGDVLCLQGYVQEQAFDVTFYQEAKMEEILKKVAEAGRVRPFNLFQVTDLSKRNFRVVTVHMYNPFVQDDDLRRFLGEYCNVKAGPRYVKDALGFWTGRRQFQVLLREDATGKDGFLHLPAMFSIGADRGTLYYARQPEFCRRCLKIGQIYANCGLRKCKVCGSDQHETRDCTAPKKCHQCGSEEHLVRECPQRRRTYADAAAGGAGGGGHGGPSTEQATGEGKRRSPKDELAKGRIGEFVRAYERRKGWEERALVRRLQGLLD